MLRVSCGFHCVDMPGAITAAKDGPEGSTRHVIFQGIPAVAAQLYIAEGRKRFERIGLFSQARPVTKRVTLSPNSAANRA